ncbi:hypothetical protein GCM10025771_01840 [Niveibacterium umoris]|uniref:Outer membrane lipoprotein-sorting protein n=1 Tax=Niveibacterium umoris TaxID=1193620 RepID=A0A840BNR4_9RHOO|nr:hypothetical protein [Niveibacterium umoris]MBB4014273.1 hypothetical protein [Niveibacterium umoris]
MLCALFGALPLWAIAAPAAPLVATVQVESRWVTADGVEKTTRFVERLVRSDNHVWTERIKPAGTPSATPDEHGQPGETHLHPSDLAGAAKLVARDKQGQVTLSFVRADLKTRVDLSPRDFDAVGFDGKWDSAWSLIDPALISRLAPSARASDVAGARWYERHARGEYMRVLWSADLALALRVESGRDDGSQRTRTVVTIAPAGQTAQPWNALASYSRKDYTDLLD